MVHKKTAMDWDNYRFFLAVARAPSIRAASTSLGTSHSTVLRKLDALELELGARLFERRGQKLSLTRAGEDVRQGALELEESVQGIGRMVTGRDAELRGVVKISSIDFFSHSNLLFDLPSFRKQFPNIQLQVDLSYRPANLMKREADVAIRIAAHPPEDLVGRNIGAFYMAAYATQDHIDHCKPHSLDTTSGMLAWGSPDTWKPRHGFDHLTAIGYFDNVLLQRDLALQGVGVASLPCLLAETIPELVRISEPLHMGDIWVVYHSDLRYTSKVRAVRDFLCASLLERINSIELA
ncbi:MAG: LysR family transcriptional regulator [Arenicella sp.]|nr:LysR family transcriptional regulator [Arenicella sp.]